MGTPKLTGGYVNHRTDRSHDRVQKALTPAWLRRRDRLILSREVKLKTLIARIFLAAALAIAAASTSAAPCIAGSFASYSALGAGGCSIGAATASAFTAYAGTSGANAIPLDTVTIVPLEIDAMTIGFDFVTTSFTGGVHQFRDFMIGYNLQGANFIGETVLVNGVELVGDGSVTVRLDGCSNGGFSSAGPGSCNGTALPPLSAVVVRSILNETSASASQSFASTTALAVITDVGLDSGLEGGARINGVAGNRFSLAAVTPVPEPSSHALLLGGLLAFAFARRSRMA